MGKKNKVGKDRRDKFYKLAKETGYRSRAAFKLIQLNRRFGFLQKSQVCIDLCAAPGGWMQVAKQNMPVSSIVIGIDLFPIKSVPGCLSIIGDITTDKTKNDLTKELKTWKADVVLNDGAPNVGRNWLFDSYQQVCLTLSALKLATQVLRPGGWFVTKVFRSKDYNALIWVLKQLFKKVHATKPSASRKESAEIFVVCQYYKAPDKIDPKFLDSKYVFEELEIEPQIRVNLLKDTNKVRKAKTEGYEGTDVRKIVPVTEFIQNENPLNMLATITELTFDDAKIEKHPRTTSEIRECCKDIKVLGRKDLKDLLKWQKLMFDEFYKKEEETKDDETVVPKTDQELEDEELLKIDKHIKDMKQQEMKELKRKKKKSNKERSKLNEKLSLKMVIKGDAGPQDEDETVFALKTISSKKEMNSLMDQEQPPDFMIASDPEDDGEKPVRPKFVKYDRETKGDLFEDDDVVAKGSDDDSDADLGDRGLGFEEDDEAELDDDETAPQTKNPLITDLDYRDKDEKRRQKAQLWFQKDAFKNFENDDELAEDYDMEKLVEKYKEDGVEIAGEERHKLTAETIEQPLGRKARRRAKHDETANEDSSSDEDEGNTKGDASKAKKIKLSEEELALGQMIVSSRKTRRDLTDAAWNRYMFNDTHLPDWFIKDEEKNMKKPAPVPHDVVEAYQKNVEDLNVRSIKKVMEAKARKKKHATKRMDKIKKKAETIMDNVDNTNQEKIRMLKRIYKKADAKKREVTYVVARKKGTSGKKVRRPAGVEGQFKVVDPRMKKDRRAEVAKAKKKGGKKTGKGKGKPKSKGGKGKK